jgi:hypothetical protein
MWKQSFSYLPCHSNDGISHAVSHKQNACPGGANGTGACSRLVMMDPIR